MEYGDDTATLRYIPVDFDAMSSAGVSNAGVSEAAGSTWSCEAPASSTWSCELPQATGDQPTKAETLTKTMKGLWLKYGGPLQTLLAYLATSSDRHNFA